MTWLRDQRSRGRGLESVIGCAGLAWCLLGTSWINLRAQQPRPTKTPTDLAGYDALLTPEDRGHWAFRAVSAPAIPAVKKGDVGPQSDRSRFILARQEEQGLVPALRTGKPRVTQRRRHLSRPDRSTADAPTSCAGLSRRLRGRRTQREGLVDSTCSPCRPLYGERWARHWLDLVRYAESNGYERDAAKPFAWRYRDYVIRAFNSDKPFYQFVLEQIAGDELPEGDHTPEKGTWSPRATTGSALGTTNRPTRNKTATISSTTLSTRPPRFSWD